jgi:hypothetical protein
MALSTQKRRGCDKQQEQTASDGEVLAEECCIAGFALLPETPSNGVR